MKNDRFYKVQHYSKKNAKNKQKKNTHFNSYQRSYSFGDLLSDVGNQEIAKFFESLQAQPKLNVSQPGDIYEQEADRIADDAVNSNINNNNNDKEVKAKNLHKKLNTKNLSVNNDSYSEIKKNYGKGKPLSKSIRDYFEPRFGVDLGNVRIHPGNQLNELARSMKAKAFTHGNDIVFEEGEYQPETTEGKKLIAHELVHTQQQDKDVKNKEINDKIDKNDNSKEENILRELGEGKPLPTSIQSKMSSIFGTDFSDVRIHTDGKAGQIANQLNARAFTVGNHIAFNSNEFKPGTPEGDIIIAHELAHTIQQKGAGESVLKKNTHENISQNTELEKDADTSIMGMILKMLGNVKSGLKQTTPLLKSGLTISRCAQSDIPKYLHIPDMKKSWLDVRLYSEEDYERLRNDHNAKENVDYGVDKTRGKWARISLPEYLKIEFIEIKDDRFVGKISEGSYKGLEASITMDEVKDWDMSKFKNFPHTKEDYQLTFVINDKDETDPTWKVWKGKIMGELNKKIIILDAVTSMNNPIPEGDYLLEIPDSPHAGGEHYMEETNQTSKSWFRISTSSTYGESERYLHPGRYTAGCATIRDMKGWIDLYNLLVLNRIDTKHVGKLKLLLNLSPELKKVYRQQ